ncbi:sterol desaturase [Emticicia sp. CRIBPO]|uniref:sterol desaturase family protein n=1 Tax=Emticicia sp. CRIBPO TaxID=2683258 RepID=UPI001411D7C9|nr:sterol desaturase family protein [Emticicia sp. CRIBPO]NBA84204.1 sterol desaturase [Emticicia sp. CRIBPO]
MELNYFALAVPFFLFFIGLEYYVAQKNKKPYFKFDSSIANINVGIVERVTDLFTVGLFYYFYDYLHQHFAIFDIKPGVLMWVALVFGTDLLWYWYHRFGHKINLFWGFHVVHHQSEEFNYTAGTRITIFQAVVRTLFWSILPIIGFPAHMISVILIIHGLYPFFTHTQLIGKLGFLEYFLVTPSHHRVHHASNEQYLDKNFGDMFIIWDKLFGTFEEEKEQPVYGLTKQLGSYSFLWQHFHFLVEIWYAAKAEKGLWNKLKVIFGSPEDFNPEVRAQAEKRFLAKDKAPAGSKRFRNYVLIQISFTLIFLFVMLLFESHLSTFLQVSASLFIIITVINCGAILEQRKWVFFLEFARISLVLITGFYYYPNIKLIIVLYVMIVALISYYSIIKKQYLNLVYGKI